MSKFMSSQINKSLITLVYLKDYRPSLFEMKTIVLLFIASMIVVAALGAPSARRMLY